MLTEEEKKIRHRLSQKKYKLSQKGKNTEYKYHHSEASKNASYKNYLKNKFKFSIHRKVRNAIKKGLLIRQACEICGKENGFAHHDDYMKPLDVRWLCNFHHCEFHRKNKN
ncbi:MAG: hypothetical protein AABY15_07630 [Nanoarchaeota archaeon]